MNEHSVHVLLVEDNPGDARLIEEMLHPNGHNHVDLSWADRLDKGIPLVSDTDVVLLDLSLPDSHGLSTYHRIKAASEDVPVIILSGVDDDNLALEAVREGAQDYLVKGHVDSGILIRAIRYAIERKRISLALRESEEQHRLLVDTMNDGLVLLDHNGRVTYANHRLCDILDMPVDQLLDRPFVDVVDAADRQMIMAFLHSDGSSPLEKPEILLRDHHNNAVSALISIQQVVNRDGQAQGKFAVVTDITQRKKLEEQLAQSQKMEAIGRLAGGVAHDFNNLLTAIMGYSDLLQAGLSDNGELLDFVDEIKKAGKRGATLVRQLLAFSRRHPTHPRILLVNDLITDMEKMLHRLIGENIDLSVVRHPDAGLIEADPAHLEQILINLAINARDAMPDGGQLTIETRGIELDETCMNMHPGMNPGLFTMIAISDTGEGMDAETRAHIFEPFFTTKKEGTGLGLATVYSAVQQSGGFITVYSEHDQGTTFKIYIPQVEEEHGPFRRDPTAFAALGGTETILLVEDENSVRILVREMLQNNGYTVLEANSGTQALEILSRNKLSIQLVISDVIMPGMSGPDMARTIHDEHPMIRFLFISGYPDHHLQHQAILDEKIPFLQKPFSPFTLTHKVREVLDDNNQD